MVKKEVVIMICLDLEKRLKKVEEDVKENERGGLFNAVAVGCAIALSLANCSATDRKIRDAYLRTEQEFIGYLRKLTETEHKPEIPQKRQHENQI